MPNENGTMTVELGAATRHLIESTLAEAKKRGEKDAKYVKSAEAYVDVLLDFAVEKKAYGWKSVDKWREKYTVGKVLSEALEKEKQGKPLSEPERKLTAAFHQAYGI